MFNSSLNLQAVVDDSASDLGDKRLFLAGFLQSVEGWEKFSQAWAAQLCADKPISYLKMSEANNYSGEFRGWLPEDRDKKIIGLRRVVDDCGMISFHSSLSRINNYEEFKKTSPRGLASPHFLCTFAIIAGVARFSATQERSIVEFIFDSQNGVDDDVSLLFQPMISGISEDARRLISGPPRFENDKLFVPIQAADMLAWHLRRRHERFGSWDYPAKDLAPLGNWHLHCGDTDEYIPEWTAAQSKIPGVEGLQSKTGWQKIKRSIRSMQSTGQDSLPAGTSKPRSLITKKPA